MDKKNFIRTTSHETAQKLIKEGFTLISNSGSEYFFLNDGKATFEKLDCAMCTNKLHI